MTRALFFRKYNIFIGPVVCCTVAYVRYAYWLGRKHVLMAYLRPKRRAGGRKTKSRRPKAKREPGVRTKRPTDVRTKKTCFFFFFFYCEYTDKWILSSIWNDGVAGSINRSSQRFHYKLYTCLKSSFLQLFNGVFKIKKLNFYKKLWSI